MTEVPEPLAGQPRHRAALENVIDATASDPLVLGVLLLGSFAAGTADALSDLDLLLVVQDGGFDRVWKRRTGLHRDALLAWDHLAGDRPVGAHRWLTSGLVLVECLIAEPASGVRLAEPFVRLSGPPDLPDRLVRREPIQRTEVDAGAFIGDPLELLYDAFKRYVRGDIEAAGRLAANFHARAVDETRRRGRGG